ncbi:DNA-binding response regulator [Micromonospora andamanensis]|uniref:Helix-turn-helix transcriptional regulator n=1 Tax=Micromonospora andamanensis TaxID=1287068 RepID=A0ABQ4I576_9ACTN|nr:response regulator transcription factor [Micromonospora andamanensis]GIJ13032.1 helix-turn-helix transcriptional regulator [Micromonospora andamanensis]
MTSSAIRNARHRTPVESAATGPQAQGFTTPAPRLRISVHASDPILHAGLIGQLRPRPEVLLLFTDTDTADVADVAVVTSDGLDEQTLRTLRRLRAHQHRIVLVAGHLDDTALVAAVEHGVVGIVRRTDATPDRLITTIRAAAAGHGTLPPDVLGQLLTHVGAVQRDILAPRGQVFVGLNPREIAVLRLAADGHTIADIAAQLSYSPRTIKNVLHGITGRYHLRNRTHAVAYALRNGLI